MTPEKATYLTLKDFFNKIKTVIKEENMKDCKIFISKNFQSAPHFALTYTKLYPTPDLPNIHITDEKPLLKIFKEHHMDFKYELHMIELFSNSNIKNQTLIHSKISWKNFIHHNFHKFPDLIEEYQKEEIEQFNNKLDKKLKPKTEPVKKMKI